MGFAKVKEFFVHVLSCGNEPEEQQRTLVIGHPTNFRREDISIVGLSSDQQEFIREKARVDALRLHTSTIPIRPARTDLGERTTNYPSGNDSFEFRQGKHGANSSHDSITLHGSDIDPEKMI